MIWLFLLSAPAHAGRVSDFCQRYLIADDPYQFESADTEWLARRIEAVEIRRRWRALDARDAAELRLLKQEARRRAELTTVIEGLR